MKVVRYPVAPAGFTGAPHRGPWRGDGRSASSVSTGESNGLRRQGWRAAGKVWYLLCQRRARQGRALPDGLAGVHLRLTSLR